MQVVNTALLKHPMNWLVIWSMALILFFLGHLLISFFSGKNPSGVNTAGPGTVPASSVSSS